MSNEQEDADATASFPVLLSFFSTELQSHASLVLGLALLVFGIVQAWGQLKPANAYLFSSLVGIMGSGIVYEMVRLYVYGKLSSALLYATKAGFNARKKEEIDDFGVSVWSGHLPLRKANVYSEREVHVTAKLLRRYRVINRKLRINYWASVFSFDVSFLLSYGALFGNSDNYLLFQGTPLLGLIVLSALSLIVGALLDLQNRKRYDRTVREAKLAAAATTLG